MCFGQADDDGYMTHSRRGWKLCEDFQKGTCKPTLPGPGYVCHKDPAKRHQCSKCLCSGHGREQCQEVHFRRNVNAKGSGKGKGKSKKGLANS